MSKSTDTRPTAPPAEIHPLFGVLTDEHDADFWLCRNAECQTPLSNSPAENKRWAAFCTPARKPAAATASAARGFQNLVHPRTILSKLFDSCS